MTDLDRAERAVRAALTHLDTPPDPQPDAAVRRVQTRRRGIVAGLALVLIIGLVGGGLSLRLGDRPISAAAGKPVGQTLPIDTAPDGWRTEYYGSISFQVPSTWGYAYEPGGDWCADTTNGKPDAQHRRPYVALGRPTVSSAVGCDGDPPASLTTEHVTVTRLDPAASYVVGRLERKSHGWWMVSEVTQAVVVATSKDHALARRIVASVVVDPPEAPCPTTSQEVRKKAERPSPAYDPAAVTTVGSMVICQYYSADEDQGGVLRAVVRLDPSRARAVLTQVQQAPVRAVMPCEGASDSYLTMIIRFETDGPLRELYLRAGSCETGSDGGWGGFDDGSNVRVLTRGACRAVLQPPARLEAAGGQVGKNCLS